MLTHICSPSLVVYESMEAVGPDQPTISYTHSTSAFAGTHTMEFDCICA